MKWSHMIYNISTNFQKKFLLCGGQIKRIGLVELHVSSGDHVDDRCNNTERPHDHMAKVKWFLFTFIHVRNELQSIHSINR